MLIQLVINGIIAGSIYALISIGFTIIYRSVKFFHFAHGIVYSVGAYIAFTLINTMEVNTIIAFFLASTTAGMFGVGIDRLVYLPLRKKKSPPLIFLIASFGVLVLFQNLIQLVYSAQVVTIRSGPVKEGYHILGGVITHIQIIIVLMSLVLLILFWYFIQKTKLGKAMRAVADDPISASMVGIDPEYIIMVAFGIGSFLAGAAGILISLETNIEPTMGTNAVFKGIIASIIGGIGSIPGSIFGGYFLGILENLGIWKIQSGWKDCISFFILIIFLLLRPGGIFGYKPENKSF
jgi:branched-chain amino acid transport system permease protein